MRKYQIMIVFWAILTMAMTESVRADVRIFFTTIFINDCKEGGTCDWKLSCALGNQQEQEFLSNSEANTNEEININRALTQKEFPPVTVTCSVQEHDGGIGAKWETVGTGRVIVRTTGSHKIRIQNNEGDVTVNFTVELLGSTAQPLVIQSKGIIYGVMNNGDLMWYRHDGRNDGSFKWATAAGKKVGNGWDVRQIFSGGDGVIYAVTNNGDLMWYRHDGRNDGSFRWAIEKKVGNGWDFKHLF